MFEEPSSIICSVQSFYSLLQTQVEIKEAKHHECFSIRLTDKDNWLSTFGRLVHWVRLRG